MRKHRADDQQGVIVGDVSIDLDGHIDGEQAAGDFLRVLLSERALCQAEDELARSDLAVANHRVALYKALGGGWK